MVGFGLILVSSVLHQLETITVARYGRKHQKGGMFFNAIICLFAAIYFFVSDTDGLDFAKKIWGYGIINSTMYALGFYSMYMALKVGSYGLTSLAASFVVVVTTFGGILFLKEPSSLLTYISLLLVVISLLLTKSKGKNKEEEVTISIKWAVYVLLSIFSNAFISIIGRMQFNAFGNTYKNEFSIISLLGATVFLLVLGCCFERDSFKKTFKQGVFYGATAGVLNGIKNLLHLVTFNYFALSELTPISTGIKLVLGFVVSMLIYKEKFSFRQLTGAIIGITAVILMNINI